ncbi:MAG: NYN domain-containing protein [Desulfosalsimonadaceae bacterium]
MGLHIVVDGYNLIRRSETLSPLDQQDLELGREGLLERLAAYKRVKGHAITVVFDGTSQHSVFGRKDSHKGIEVKFSRHGETADAVIKRIARTEREKALVVSSDHEVADFSASQGAAVIGAAEFEQRLDMAEYMEIKGADPDSDGEQGWVPDTRKKGPSKKPPKRKRKNRQKIKKL